MQSPFKLNSGVSLADYTVVFPSVCVGNVAQLTIDLMISTLQMKKVATVWHPAIIPILGPRAFQHKSSEDDDLRNITTSCELFISATHKLACFQLRSPLVPDQLGAFFDEFKTFLQTQNISNVIILASSYAHEQHSIDATKFMYLANEQFKTTHKQQLSLTNWKEWDADNRIIHGGGFAMKLWQQVVGIDVASCLLFKYVSEGDNRADAIQLVEQLNKLESNRLLAGGKPLHAPVSWKALFGNDPTEQLY